MYATFFGITQDPSGNPYLVTNLVVLILGCTFAPFTRNITWPLTPAVLPTRRTVIENLELLDFFHGGVYLCSQEPLAHLHNKGRRFIKIQLKVMSKMSKNITRWVCPSHILPLCPNHHVPTVLLWHKNMWLVHIFCLRFNHPPMPLHIWQPLLPNKLIQVIICLEIRTCLYYVWYFLYHLLTWHTKFRHVSSKNYIVNIIYLPLR